MVFIFYKQKSFNFVLTKTEIEESRNEKETSMDQKIVLRTKIKRYILFCQFIHRLFKTT